MSKLYIAFVIASFGLACAAASGVAPLIELNDGNIMPGLALGTWLGNSSTGRIKPMGHEMETALLWAIEAGYRHVDTASAYEVEDQIGRAVRTAAGKQALRARLESTTTPKVCDVSCYLKKMKDEGQFIEGFDNVPSVAREELFITTKLWNTEHAQEAVVPALRESLRQLQLDYVDLYLIHWPLGLFPNGSFDNTDYIDTWRGMVQAKIMGLTTSIGVSNFNQEMLQVISDKGLPRPAVLQIEWNLNLQQPKLLAYCRKHNIAVMGYMTLGSLLPSRALPDAPPPRINDPFLKAIAKKHNKSVPQIVLRYAVESGVTPIPKSMKKARIRQNIDIFDFSLDAQDKLVLRGFDKGYRTVPQKKWEDHKFYPFERPVPSTTMSIPQLRALAEEYEYS